MVIHLCLGTEIIVTIKMMQLSYTQLPKAIRSASRIILALFVATASMDLYLEVEMISSFTIIAIRQIATIVVQTIRILSLQVKSTYLELITSLLKKSRFIPSLSNSLIIGFLTNYSLNTIIRLKSH